MGRARLLGLLPLVAAALLAGCASPAAPPAATPGAAWPAAAPAMPAPAWPPHLGRVQQATQDGVTVHLAVPTDEAAARHFGVALAAHGIQPLWLRVDNAGDTGFWLQPVAIDPDYDAPDEAALAAGAGLGAGQLAALRARLRAEALPFHVPAHASVQGHVYAVRAQGGRLVDVRLAGAGRAVRLRFAVLLPAQAFDYERSGLAARLAQQAARPDLAPDLAPEQLREQLRALPCCTTDAAGQRAGDPLNLALVGPADTLLAALMAAGWQFTESIGAASVGRMVEAAATGRADPGAPVSALYAFGRPQDMALQRGRAGITRRNHMRLWLAPWRSGGQPVWLGQVSRDIGVKLTTLSPTLTTHVIDPLVDESREYLLQSLLHQEAVQRFAFVRGVGPATAAAPRRNLGDDPYQTDGMRLVVWLAGTPVPAHLAQDLGWNGSADPSREGQGDAALVPAATAPRRRE